MSKPWNTTLNAVHLPALHQQGRKTPMAWLSLCGTLDEQHSTVCCLWTSNPHSNCEPQTPQAGRNWNTLNPWENRNCLWHIIIDACCWWHHHGGFQVHEEHLCSSGKVFPVLWVAMVGLSSFRLSLNPDDLAGASSGCLIGVSQEEVQMWKLQKVVIKGKEPSPCQTPVRINWLGHVLCPKELGLYLFCLLFVCTVKCLFK